MPVFKYPYEKTELKDTSYARALIERDIAPVAGITYQAPENRTIIQFDRELTDSEKSDLDDIISRNPVPASRYEFGALEAEDYIETIVGVRPVRVDYDEEGDVATVDFDAELTSVQESELKTAIKGLKTGRILRRI